VSFRAMPQFAAGLMISGCLAASAGPAWGQEEINRKVKSKPAPIYPELARRMSITGVVKVQITVATNGVVKDAKLVGGHPVLANAALDAIRKWRYEASKEETTGVVEFRFDPAQ
jgi:TonB family protein